MSNYRPILILLMLCGSASASIREAIEHTQPKIVKIYGAGGFQGMESYQSGILISPEGHILTAFGYVLDTDSINAVLTDGRRFDAKLLGADPRLEIAVLKIDAAGLPCFDLNKSQTATPGVRVLAFSNLFGVAMGDEQASVQRGTVAAVTRLDGRRGVFETPYRGPVYVLDVTTSNPGSAGGALVTRRGELVGLLGKELRNSMSNTWLNFAVPIDELRRSADEIRSGKFVPQREAEAERKPQHPLDLASLGIVLIPDVLERTPPYIDQVRSDSPAEKAGIRPDDLVIMLDGRLIQSCKALTAGLEYIDREDQAKLSLLRGQDLVEVTLRSTTGPSAKSSKKERP